MTINPIRFSQVIKPLRPIHNPTENLKPAEAPSDFPKTISNLIDSVERTEAATKKDAYDLAVGNSDDMHTAMINAAKADITLQAAVQIRNKLIKAYNKIMRINL